MPKFFTEAQIDAYRRDGFGGPFPLLAKTDAAEIIRKIEGVEAKIGAEMQSRFKIKAHLPFPWLCDLIRHKRLLDAVEDVIGPNILCWGSSFFMKDAHDPRFVSWHQDSTYYGLDPAETFTTWVTLNDSTRASGCVRFMPGSHRGSGQVKHVETHDENNLLVKGQTIEGIDESKAVPLEVPTGHFSVHHERTYHASDANNADWRRIALSIHYVAPSVRQTLFEGATAALVRGKDTHGFWRLEPLAKLDFDPDCMVHLDEAFGKYKAAGQRDAA